LPVGPPPSDAPVPKTVTWTPLPPAPAFLAHRVRSAGSHRCAVARDGRVACWGDLGGTPYLHTGVAHLVAGVTDAIDVAFSGTDVCVVRSGGALDCLALEGGERQVPAFTGSARELELMAHELCVLESSGHVACHDTWDRSPFTRITGITGATSLTCTSVSCCATTPTGVMCFGDAAPDIGMIKSKAGRSLPGAPAGTTEIAYHSFGACARTAAGGAHCWGDAATLTRPSGVRGVALFDHDLCVIGSDGAMACTRGPVAGTHVVAAEGACMTRDDGSAYCTGTNLSGELGDGRPTFATTPQRVPDLENIVDLRVTETQVCAIARDRTMTCWGWAARTRIAGATGLFGSGDEPACWLAAGTLTCHVTQSTQGAPLKQVTAAIAVRGTIKLFATGGGAVCVVDGGGALTCASEIWKGDPDWIPVTSPKVVELHELDRGLCARFVDGRVGCLATETGIDPGGIRLVPGITDAVQLAGGTSGACVITRAREVACWSERDELRPIPGLRGATAISTRGMHVCGLVGGELLCAGINTLGQLGDGTRVEPPDGAAVRAKLAGKPTKFGVAGQATCALDDGGHVWCWGTDQHGELGQGRLPYVETPSHVVGVGPR
jgi:hypothetical protein